MININLSNDPCDNCNQNCCYGCNKITENEEKENE